MHQHPYMKSLDIVTACRDTLYTSNALFPDNRSIQDGKAACSISRTNVTPICYLSCDLSYTVDQVYNQIFGCLNIIIVYLFVRLTLEQNISVIIFPMNP